MEKGNGFVVVDSDGAKAAGQVVYWRLSGRTDLETLARAWEAEGLDPKLLPNAPTSRQALRSAMGEHRRPRLLLRPLPAEKGYTLVAETEVEEDLDYSVGLKAYVDETPDTAPAVRFNDSAHPLAPAVASRFAELLGSISPGDIGAWLSDTARRFDAVSLRDSGGIYFVPRHRLEEWRAVVRAVRAATGHQIFGMPAMPADETVLAVIDAVTTEAEAQAESIEAEVVAVQVGGKGVLGKRGLETRTAQVKKTEEKLSRYEEIVGQRLDGIRERLERVRAGLVSAIMMAASEETEVAA